LAQNSSTPDELWAIGDGGLLGRATFATKGGEMAVDDVGRAEVPCRGTFVAFKAQFSGRGTGKACDPLASHR
jgi:hypothetical protein